MNNDEAIVLATAAVVGLGMLVALRSLKNRSQIWQERALYLASLLDKEDYEPTTFDKIVLGDLIS